MLRGLNRENELRARKFLKDYRETDW